MRKIKITTFIFASLAMATALVLGGCGYSGQENQNIKPIVILYNNPISGDTLGAAPVVCWQGFDTDGKVYEYEFIDLPRQQAGSTGGVRDSLFLLYKNDPSLLANLSHVLTQGGDTLRWNETEDNCDTVFLSLLVQGEVTEHLFCIRALDHDLNNQAFSDVECATYYRTSLPPDTCEITTLDFEGNEFWCLDDTIYSWKGIKVSWRGSDPDNSILLEYRWVLENTTTNTVVLSSRSEDSLAGISSGLDPYDGWIRNNSTMMKGNVPTGEYRFIVQVRDDAFFAGAADTAIINIAHPQFDISRPSVLQQYADGTYPNHRVLLIDQNESWFYMFDNLNNIRQYYAGVMQGLKDSGVIAGWDSVRSGYATLDVDRATLSQYNILYILDQDGSYNFKMDEGFWTEVMDYIMVGGRVIIDGRNSFNRESSSWTNVPSYSFFGIEEDFAGTARAVFASANRNPNLPASEYPNLTLNTTLVPANELAYVNRLGARGPQYGGSPYTQILYSYGISASTSPEDSVDYGGGPVAVRYVTPSFRTAYFAFPLYLMDDSSNQVKTVIRSTVEFIKGQVLPMETED